MLKATINQRGILQVSQQLAEIFRIFYIHSYLHFNASFGSVPDNNRSATLISKLETISTEVETIVTQKKEDITKYQTIINQKFDEIIQALHSIDNIQCKQIEPEPDYQIIAHGSSSSPDDIMMYRCSISAYYMGSREYLMWTQPESARSVKNES